MPDLTLRFRSEERAFLTGKTGSGKTFAAKRLFSRFPRIVVMDPKGTLTDWGLEPWGREARRKLREGEAVRTRVAVEYGDDPAETWESVFDEVYRAGNCTLYIDEMYGVVPPGSQPSPGLTAIWTRGRELGVGAYAASQRPTWVPLFVLSEAEHFMTFRLALAEDRRRMSAFLGPEVMDPITDRHGLWYAKATWDRPVYIERLPFGDPPEVEPGPPESMLAEA